MILVRDGWRFCKGCGVCLRQTRRHYYVLGRNAYGLTRWDTYCKVCRRRQTAMRKHRRRPYDPNGPYRLRLAAGEKLDPGPFADWLRRTYPDADPCRVAALLGCESKQIRSVLAHHQKTIGLTVVDRAFVRFGHPELLAVLYPLER